MSKARFLRGKHNEQKLIVMKPMKLTSKETQSGLVLFAAIAGCALGDSDEEREAAFNALEKDWQTTEPLFPLED